MFFFLATADAEGRPDCSFKGGPPGFVRVVGPGELAFPDYDGNGMFKSLGNILANPNVGLLFIDMGEQAAAAARQRHGAASAATIRCWRDSVGAQLIVRVKARAIFPNCPRYIPTLGARRALDLCAAAGLRSARAGVEGLRRLQGLRSPAAADAQGRIEL